MHSPDTGGILQQVCDDSRPFPKRRHAHWHHEEKRDHEEIEDIHAVRLV